MDTKMNVDDIKISGMTCASCVKAVERAVKKLDGVESVQVNLATEKATISYEVGKVKMYEIKNELLIDYKEWVKGVDNPDQALADHQDDYHATFKQGVYTIILGDGLGKSLTGDLKVNYCETTKDLKTKSLIWDWLF